MPAVNVKFIEKTNSRSSEMYTNVYQKAYHYEPTKGDCFEWHRECIILISANLMAASSKIICSKIHYLSAQLCSRLFVYIYSNILIKILIIRLISWKFALIVWLIFNINQGINNSWQIRYTHIACTHIKKNNGSFDFHPIPKLDYICC